MEADLSSTPHVDKEREKLRRRALFAVFVTIFLDILGFSMFIPILPLVAKGLQASNSEAVALGTFYSIGTMIAVTLLGRLSDKIGRRKVLLITILISVVMQLLTGLASTYIFLAITRFFAGAASGNISVAQAAISDITVPEKRAPSMVIIGVAFGLGFAVGPMMSGQLSKFFPDNQLLAIAISAAALNVLNLVLILVRLPETHHKFASGKTLILIKEVQSASTLAVRASAGYFADLKFMFKNRPFRILTVLNFLQVFGFVGIESVLPLLLIDAYGYARIDVFGPYTVLGVTVLLTQGAVSRPVLKRLGEVRTLNIGQLLLAMSVLSIGFVAPSREGLWMSLILLGIGNSLANPSINALVSRVSPAETQGFSFGIVQTWSAIARIIGPVFMGVLYERFNGGHSLLFSAVLIFMGWVIGLLGLSNLHHQFKNNQRKPAK